MDIQQAINFEIMERFEKEEIHFASPVRVVFLQNADALMPSAHTHK
jgi:small-conductance mechanosensitive channel